MPSLSLSVFCAPHELTCWLGILGQKFDLAMVAYKGARLEDRTTDLTSISPDVSSRIYLYPPRDEARGLLPFNRIEPRKWGWIDVTPGRYLENQSPKVILMTEFNVETFEKKGIPTGKAIKFLKREMGKSATAGVIGRSTVTGGESKYGHIWYTPDAKEKLNQGFIWKQKIEFNSIFFPAAP